MAAITADDIADLSHALYDAAFDDRLWPEGMGKLKRLLNVSSAALGFAGEKSGGFVTLYGDCDPYYESLAFSGTLPNPFLPALMRAPVDAVVSDGQLMPRPAFEKTAFFNDWLAPQGEHGLMSIKTLQRSRQYGYLSVSRGGRQHRIDDEDVALARRIAPMVRRITDLRLRVGALRLSDEAGAFDRIGVGMLVVDAQGRLLRSNAAAEAILGEPGTPLKVLGGMLDAGRSATALRQALANAMEPPDGERGLGDSLAVGGPAGVALTVSPLQDGTLYDLPAGRAAIIFVQRLKRPADWTLSRRLRGLFGLTAREAEVAAALSAGSSVTEIATQLDISVVTARSHLAQLFNKTETRQQSQLVALLKSILPLGH